MEFLYAPLLINGFNHFVFILMRNRIRYSQLNLLVFYFTALYYTDRTPPRKLLLVHV